MSRSALRGWAAGAALAATLLARAAAAQRGAPEDSVMAKLRQGVAAEADSAAEPEPAHPTGPAALDSTVRVIGTRLKFGTSPQRVVTQVGPLETSKQRGRRGEVVRDCNAPWFGLPATITLFFRNDQLARAHIIVAQAAPHEVLYVDDQLRRSAFKRMNAGAEADHAQSEWRGPTRVMLTNQGGHLDAMIEPVPKPAPPPPPPPPPPPLPDVFVLERSGVTYAVPLPEFATRPRPAPVPRSGVMGRVWIRGAVDTSGTLHAPQIVKSIASLDSAAIASARGTRFKPYVVNGVARAIVVEFPVVFTLAP